MNAYRQHMLSKVQDANTYGRGADIFDISKAVVDAIEIRAGGDDDTAAALLKRLIHAANTISGPQDHTGWNGFREVYGEALFYVVARERNVMLRAIPTAATPTPDFESAFAPSANFEVKTFNVKGGVYAQDATQLEGLESNIEANERAKERGVGISHRVVSPHGAGATLLDTVHDTIDKIANNVKRGQFAQSPTYLVAILERLAIHTGADHLQREHVDRFHGALSGTLWHVAWGEVGMPFHWIDADGARRTAPLTREGVLRQKPFVSGIVFLDGKWSEQAEFDGAFRHQSYELLGARRHSETRDQHERFDELCDAVSCGTN